MNGEVARARLSGPASCLPFFEYYLTSVWGRISATLPQAGKSGPAPGFCAPFWGQNRGQNSFLPSSRMAENLEFFFIPERTGRWIRTVGSGQEGKQFEPSSVPLNLFCLALRAVLHPQIRRPLCRVFALAGDTWPEHVIAAICVPVGRPAPVGRARSLAVSA